MSKPIGDADPGHWRIGDEVRLRVRVGLDDAIERLFVRTCPDGEQSFQEMTEVAAGPACRWWEATLRLTMPTTDYRFLVIVAGGHRWLNGTGRASGIPTDANDFRLLAGYSPVDWLDDRVFYQIFPGPFRQRRPVQRCPRAAPGPTAEHRPSSARGTNRRRPAAGRSSSSIGGDLQGIEEHLDHLDRLGVNALYLTPDLRRAVQSRL